MFRFINRKNSVQNSQIILSDFFVENSKRISQSFIDSIMDNIVDGYYRWPNRGKFAIELEFTAVVCYFCERTFSSKKIKFDFDEFMRPIRVLSLYKMLKNDEEEKKYLKFYMDSWESASEAYYAAKFFHAPTGVDFNESVTGIFGSRMANIFNESEHSFLAKQASALYFTMINSLHEHRVVEKILDNTNWK